MGTEIIGGRAGRVWPQVLAAVREAYQAGNRCIVLVPEQFTLQAERDLVEALQVPGFFDIQVFSPSRLTRKVFELAGQDGRTLVDEKGRRMALSLCLSRLKEDLHYYASAAEKRGFAQKVSALIGDLKRGGMTCEDYADYVASLPEDVSRLKQHDVLTIWQAYEAHMAGRFADGEDVQRAMLQKLPQTGIFKDACIYLFGFDLLPHSLVEVLCLAAAEGSSLMVTFTMDRADARDGEIFGPVRKSAMRLKQALEEKNLPVRWQYLAAEPLQAAPAIRHLEANLYAYPAQRMDGIPEGIRVHSAPTPYDEAVYVAAQLRRLHEAGIPWGEMYVALAAEGSYASLLPMVMESFHIPFYLNAKAPGAAHPLIRFLMGALRAAAKGWPQREMIALAKSPFGPLEAEEGFQLENYALENGIQWVKWQKPFTRGEAAEAMEPLRQRLMEPLLKMKKALAESKSAGESLTAVFELLEDLQCYDRLLSREEELLSRGMELEAAQNRQVWRQLLAVLDQMHELMDGRRIPVSLLPQWLEAGLDEMELSALPPAPDTVQAGPVGHLMMGNMQAVFIMGLQDGALSASQQSLITDAERAHAQETTGRMLGSTGEELSQLARSDLYRTCAMPSARLYLTYAQASTDGQTLRPNALIHQLRSRVFPDLAVSGGAAWSSWDEGIWAPRAAIERVGPMMLKAGEAPLDEPWQETVKWLWQQPNYREKVTQVLNTLQIREENEPIDPRTAWQLFGQDRTSISRLETYAQCPFKHYVNYGLSPQPRREYAFLPDEKGTFFHQALMAYVRRAAQEPKWPEITREVSDALMDEVLPPMTSAWEEGPLGDNRAARNLGEQCIRIVKRAAWMVVTHAKVSQFRTLGTEIVFGMEGGLPPVILELPDGRKAALRGVIDRVDYFENDEGTYLRVVDYKSSVHHLEPEKMWNGLQLQLILYLKAALAVQDQAKPSGAFYFTVKDPLVETAQDIKEAAEKEIARELKLRGVVLKDVKIVHAMDGDTGLSLGTVLKKNGEPYKGAAVFSLEQMQKLMAHAQKTAQDLWQQVNEGQIQAAPAALGNWQACDQCDYRGICRFDPRLPGCLPRKIPPMDLEQMQNKLDAIEF